MRILAIAVILSFNLKGHARIAAVTFSGTTLMHELLSREFNGLWYCANDAVACFFIVAAISKLKTLTFIARIIDICIIAIIFDIIGCILWYRFVQDVDFINHCFVALYIYSCVLIWRGENNADVGHNTLGALFRFHPGKDDFVCDRI